MSLGFGIFLVVVGLWICMVAIRAMPVGSYKSPHWQHRSMPGDFLTAGLLVATAWGTGIPLILGVSWWWVPLVCCGVVTALCLMIIGRMRYGRGQG